MLKEKIKQAEELKGKYNDMNPVVCVYKNIKTNKVMRYGQHFEPLFVNVGDIVSIENNVKCQIIMVMKIN